MQNFFNKKPSLEEFVRTYEKLMCEDFEKVMQEDEFSESEKDLIDDERRLSFEVLEGMLADIKMK